MKRRTLLKSIGALFAAPFLPSVAAGKPIVRSWTIMEEDMRDRKHCEMIGVPNLGDPYYRYHPGPVCVKLAWRRFTFESSGRAAIVITATYIKTA